DGRGDADEDALMRFEMASNDGERAAPIAFAGQRHIEDAGVELEQAGQQLRVVDVRTVGRVAIAARAGVDADALALGGAEARQREIVEIDEAVEQRAARLDFHGEPAFGEIDLHCMCSLVQATAYLAGMLIEEVSDELFARITSERLLRIHQAERGG